MFETNPPPAVTVSPLVIVDLCDGTVDSKEFANTGFSRLAAREYYFDKVKEGDDLQIANQPPHVVKVQFSDGVSSEIALTEFRCRCLREQRIMKEGITENGVATTSLP